MPVAGVYSSTVANAPALYPPTKYNSESIVAAPPQQRGVGMLEATVDHDASAIL
jgi:hypothetical protein